MIAFLKTFKFYLAYYLTNHVISRIPFHAVRLAWYRNAAGIKIGEGAQIWLGCKFLGDAVNQIEIGKHAVLASDVTINASAPVHIGDHVAIASGVLIITSDHDCQDPLFTVRKAPVHIHKGAWIASRAILLKGVTVGEGAVVTAGSVVFQDVKPFTIVGGNPARLIGPRTPPTSLEMDAGRPPLFC